MQTLLLKITRLALLALVTAVLAPPAALARLLSIFSPEAGTRASSVLSMLWSTAACAVMGVRVDVSGEPGIAPGFTVSNHVSYMDIAVIGSIAPSVFLAKSEVARWPVLGQLSWLAAAVYVDRESGRGSMAALVEAGRVLDSGVSMVVFPEGTSTDGSRVGEFKPMFFDVPARRRSQVTPVSIKYAAEDGADTVPWYGDAEFVPHFWRLLGAGRIEAMVHIGYPVSVVHANSVSACRKVLAEAVREDVADGLRRLERAGFGASPEEVLLTEM